MTAHESPTTSADLRAFEPAPPWIDAVLSCALACALASGVAAGIEHILGVFTALAVGISALVGGLEVRSPHFSRAREAWMVAGTSVLAAVSVLSLAGAYVIGPLTLTQHGRPYQWEAAGSAATAFLCFMLLAPFAALSLAFTYAVLRPLARLRGFRHRAPAALEVAATRVAHRVAFLAGVVLLVPAAVALNVVLDTAASRTLSAMGRAGLLASGLLSAFGLGLTTWVRVTLALRERQRQRWVARARAGEPCAVTWEDDGAMGRLRARDPVVAAPLREPACGAWVATFDAEGRWVDDDTERGGSGAEVVATIPPEGRA